MLTDDVLGNQINRRIKRVISGEDARKNELPYMAQLRDKYEKTHVCGGTIVSSFHVLSAAHCVCQTIDYCDRPDTLEFVLGSINLNGEGGEVFEIELFYIPSTYVLENSQSDITVAKVGI